jgi:hypothetical protein
MGPGLVELLDGLIKGTLALAEHVVIHSSRLWLEATLDQRQRRQELFFP